MPTNKETFNSEMTALANSINSKAGTTGKKNILQMKAAVDSIVTGADTSDATATAADIASGKTAYIATGKVTGTAMLMAQITVNQDNSIDITVP